MRAPARHAARCALVAAAVLAGCRRGPGVPAVPPEGQTWVSPEALARGEVRVEEVRERDLPRSIAVTGRVAFDDLRVTHVFSPVTGRITRVLAQPGQKVRKGSPLVAILSPDVGSAFSDLLKAHADLVSSDSELRRQQEIVGAHAGSQRDLEAAQDAAARARAEYERARQRASLLHQGSVGSVTQEVTLRSFLEGEVISRAVNPGAEVQGQYSGGSPPELFTIGDIDRVWVQADVPQAEVPRVRLGAAARVRVVAYPDRVFEGKVDYVSPALDPVLRTARIRLALENPDAALKPEMYASVSIAGEPKRTVAVPRRALATISEQSFVYVQAGTRPDGRLVFDRRLVRVEDDEGDEVPVVEGLSAGDRVVVEGNVGRETADDEARLTRAQIAAAGIEIAPARLQDVDDALTVGGRLAFDDNRVTHVFSPVSGRVTKVLAAPGERVRRGAPLAAILSPDVGSAQSDLVKAQADLTAAGHEYRRQKELFEARAGARRDLEAAEGTFRKARAEFERAREKTSLLRAGTVDRVTQEFVLRSPMDGLVVARSVNPGMEVQGQYSGASNAPELFTVGETDRLWVLGDVYEMDLPLVREGQAVTFRSTAAPDGVLRGTIEWVSDVLDPQLRTARVRCAIENPDRALKPEMYEQVSIRVPGTQVIAVPRAAVLRVGGGTAVFVEGGEAPDGKRVFKLRRVQAREEKPGGLVPITRGLADGERVVVRGAILVLGLLST